jgi:hypothetical protein
MNKEAWQAAQNDEELMLAVEYTGTTDDPPTRLSAHTGKNGAFDADKHCMVLVKRFTVNSLPEGIYTTYDATMVYERILHRFSPRFSPEFSSVAGRSKGIEDPINKRWSRRKDLIDDAERSLLEVLRTKEESEFEVSFFL